MDILTRIGALKSALTSTMEEPTSDTEEFRISCGVALAVLPDIETELVELRQDIEEAQRRAKYYCKASLDYASLLSTLRREKPSQTEYLELEEWMSERYRQFVDLALGVESGELDDFLGIERTDWTQRPRPGLSDEQYKEWQSLHLMVDEAGFEMKARLYQKMLEGHTGWNNRAELPGLISNAVRDVDRVGCKLEPSLFDRDAVRRHAIDAMNRLAMIWSLLGEAQEPNNAPITDEPRV